MNYNNGSLLKDQVGNHRVPLLGNFTYLKNSRHSFSYQIASLGCSWHPILGRVRNNLCKQIAQDKAHRAKENDKPNVAGTLRLKEYTKRWSYKVK